MKYRKLRIAWSATWGVLGVLIVAMWLRSCFWRADSVTYIHSVQTTIYAYSAWGRCWIQITPQSWADVGSNMNSYDLTSQSEISLPNSLLGFYFHRVPSEDSVFFVFPYWFPVMLAGVIAAAPWLHWRFSLRTLLAGMALLAFILGLIIATTR
jgi:hypothetical protein